MTDSTWTRRDFLRQSTGAAVATAVGGPALLGACSRVDSGGNTLQQAKQQGSIPIGIADEAPYGFKNAQGTVTGEGPEVARAVLENLGIPEIEATTARFDSLIPGLRARRFDLVTAGMYITPARCAKAAFSIPDYTAPSAFLVPKGNPRNITRFTDVAATGVKLATLSAAAERGYALEQGVKKSQIQIFDSQNALLQAVTDGRVYCSSLTTFSLQYVADNNREAQVEVTEGFTPVIGGKKQTQAGAFTFRKGEDRLRAAFNRELRKLHENGEWLRIVEPFGFGEENLPPEGLTAQELCTPESPSPTSS